MQRGSSLAAGGVSTATRTSHSAAKLNKISDETSPPFWQTACWALAIWDSKKNFEDFAKLKSWAKAKSPSMFFTSCPKWAKKISIILQTVQSHKAKNHWFFYTLSSFANILGWWAGRAWKCRSHFLALVLALWCERSEHDKSQLWISLDVLAKLSQVSKTKSPSMI